MYWKVNVVTKIDKELTLILEGKRNEILSNLELDGLKVLDISPDFVTTIQKLMNQGVLPSSKLSPFFIDFSRMLKSLTVSEAARTMATTTSDPLIKAGLERIRVSINDGHSLKTAFENAKIFPKIVCVSLEAAERGGQIQEVSKKLGEYFQYLTENKNKVLGSLVYPCSVFIAISVGTVVISINLIPQLSFLIPPDQMNSFSMQLLIGYANFMKNYWMMVIVFLVLIGMGMVYLWNLYKEKFMKYVFQIPIVGNVLKEIEFTNLFLNLFIYLKSGISILEALTFIYSNQNNYVTNKLIKIKERINAGATMGESFEKDDFFPEYINQNLKKGDETGKRTEYLYETYEYYDLKSKQSIKVMIGLINPILMTVAFGFFGVIVSFYVLIYKNMGAMSSNIYH